MTSKIAGTPTSHGASALATSNLRCVAGCIALHYHDWPARGELASVARVRRVTTAATLMVQGTASSVGKSLVVTALCRYFQRYGVRVAPFKAQNMSLNAAVTPDGFEIGRAQAVQAEAARIAARVEMNPILLKPESELGAQLVLMGKPAGRVQARDFGRDQGEQRRAVERALATLRADFELVLIEGAGSPVELNLKDRDLVNMHVAKLADAPVILVGDIDRGGVFASLYGTLALLPDDERARVAALLVNKFRGERALFEPGIAQLRALCDKPVLGVLPHLSALRIADEDSVSLAPRLRAARALEPLPESAGVIDLAVIALPHLANYDDLLALEHEPDVRVRFVREPAQLQGADLVIVPGTKSTLVDLDWLRASGFAEALQARARAGGLLLGICGGCQMLGERIEDPDGVESSAPSRVEGLGLLPLHTRFESGKRTAQALARTHAASFLADAGEALPARGYELHMGRVVALQPTAAAFEISERNGKHEQALDGAVHPRGHVLGTMLHGLFDDAALRTRLLTRLRARRGLGPHTPRETLDEYDRLADAVEQHLDTALLWRLIGRAQRA
ncbi:MAG TPA: cobyric acid synthase [Polyangiales bacterium]|nr:cobyric acid synthase [Polyangiales bacterium]